MIINNKKQYTTPAVRVRVMSHNLMQTTSPAPTTTTMSFDKTGVSTNQAESKSTGIGFIEY